ncbi:hypothetical protein J3458_015168 [Metarhizium acridum]|uniref:uncharacterized protein n=1 Tax=Metarhizium acridum TaxID=92637 RepID=UPI001C6C7C93|nr:hypothetical protein J3458_015168 [Metarhizium acridum]
MSGGRNGTENERGREAGFRDPIQCLDSTSRVEMRRQHEQQKQKTMERCRGGRTKEERGRNGQRDAGSERGRKEGRVWRCEACGLCQGNKLQMSRKEGARSISQLTPPRNSRLESGTTTVNLPKNYGAVPTAKSLVNCPPRRTGQLSWTLLTLQGMLSSNIELIGAAEASS